MCSKQHRPQMTCVLFGTGREVQDGGSRKDSLDAEVGLEPTSRRKSRAEHLLGSGSVWKSLLGPSWPQVWEQRAELTQLRAFPRAKA